MYRYAFCVSATAALVLALSPAVATAARDDASLGNGSKASSLALDGVRGRALAIEVAPGLALGLRSQTPPNGGANGQVGSNGNNGNNGDNGNGGNAGASVGGFGGNGVGAVGAGASGAAPVPEPSSMLVFGAGLLIARGWAGRLARRVI